MGDSTSIGVQAGSSLSVQVPLLTAREDGASVDPRTNPSAIADLYHALPTGFGRGLEHLHAAVPALDRWSVRLAEVGVAAAALTPLSVYVHELGHYERAEREGYDASVTMTGLGSGYTSWHYGDTPPSAQTRLSLSLAGVNQEELSSETIYHRATVHDRGRLNWATGVAYVIARTNLPGYQIRSALLSVPAPGDDMARWKEWLVSTGRSLSLGGSAALSTAAALASPLLWASIVGGVRYIAGGDSTVEIPALSVGAFRLQAPDLHVYLHPSGPLLEGRTALRHDASGVSVEAHGFGEVGGSSAGGGVRVNQIPLARRLTLSPHAGFSGSANGFGYEVGAEVGIRFNPRLSASADISAQANHPLAEATGQRQGVSANVGLQLRF